METEQQQHDSPNKPTNQTNNNMTYPPLLLILFLFSLCLLFRASHQEECTYPRFHRSDFFIQGITYLPTETDRNVTYVSLKQGQSERLVPPFREMLGSVPEEKYLGRTLRDKILRMREASSSESSFVNSFFRPQSLFGHAFPDEHREVFFFPFCCKLDEGTTEESLRADIKELLADGFFDDWWPEVSFDSLEKLYYEYRVFGACSGKKWSVREYFEQVHNLLDKLQADQLIFDKSGIKKGLSEEHTVTSARNAIREEIDAQVVFQCLYDEGKKKNLLHQVWFCYDSNLQLIDCPLQLQAEESCTRHATGLDGKKIELLDFYIPSWEDMIGEAGKTQQKDEL